MIFKEFYISDKNGKSNCVIRSLCKILNKEYEDVYNGLCEVSKELKRSSFNDIEVFEKYMEDNNIIKINRDEDIKVKDLKNINVLVLCAGAGTSAMLANALVEGAKELNLPISATAGAYGSHYEIMKDFDMIILAPQVASYYDDIKADADRLNVKLIATKGVEYINLTRDPKKAVEFVLSQI